MRTRGDGRGEFNIISTGQAFVPRGSNFIRVADQVKPTGEATNTHSTFAPGLYDSAGAEAALASMEKQGYNFVRVFITGTTTTSVSTASGINTGYVTNLVDFLTRAKAHSVQVLISLDEWLPYAYDATLAKAPNPLASGVNAFYLSNGGIQAHAAFFSDFVGELRRQKAPMDTVLGYTLRNEQSFDSTQPPLTLTAGTFSAPNGRVYDLSRSDQRSAVLQEGLNYFIDQVRSAILAKDAGALVGIGFFAPQAPNPFRAGDTRFVTSAGAISSSTADFIDLHPYPGDLSLQQYAQNFGIPNTSPKSRGG